MEHCPWLWILLLFGHLCLIRHRKVACCNMSLSILQQLIFATEVEEMFSLVIIIGAMGKFTNSNMRTLVGSVKPAINNISGFI